MSRYRGTVPQYIKAMRLLSKGPTYTYDLAGWLGKSPGNLAQSLTPARRKGWVDRQESGDKGFLGSLWLLTEAGAQALEEMTDE